MMPLVRTARLYNTGALEQVRHQPRHTLPAFTYTPKHGSGETPAQLTLYEPSSSSSTRQPTHRNRCTASFPCARRDHTPGPRNGFLLFTSSLITRALMFAEARM